MAEFIKVELETFIDEIRKYPVRKKTETPSESQKTILIFLFIKLSILGFSTIFFRQIKNAILYGLPKLQKPDIPLKSDVSAIKNPTDYLSHFITHF